MIRFPTCPDCRKRRQNQLRYKRAYYQRNAEAVKAKKRVPQRVTA